MATTVIIACLCSPRTLQENSRVALRPTLCFTPEVSVLQLLGGRGSGTDVLVWVFSVCALRSSGESSGILGYERDRTYRTGGDTAYF